MLVVFAIFRSYGSTSGSGLLAWLILSVYAPDRITTVFWHQQTLNSLSSTVKPAPIMHSFFNVLVFSSDLRDRRFDAEVHDTNDRYLWGE